MTSSHTEFSKLGTATKKAQFCEYIGIVNAHMYGHAWMLNCKFGWKESDLNSHRYRLLR